MANKSLVRITMTLPDGTRKYYSGKTKKEAEEKRDRDKLLMATGWDVGDDTTFKELADSWFFNYSKKGLALRSVQTTQGILDRYLLPTLGPMQLKKIKPIHIDRMLGKYSELSVSSQRKMLNVANQIFQLAVENELIPREPTKGKKPIAKDPDPVLPLTKEQCNILLQATKGTRVYPFIVVLMFCGLRRGEALGLMWKDIDFKTGLLTVERSVIHPVGNKRGEINTALKSDAAHRSIPMSNEVIEVLKEQKRNSTSAYVFPQRDGGFMSETSFRKMWDLILYRTDKECGGLGGEKRDTLDRPIKFHVHPHQLRHTCCTQWIYAGMNPKEVQYLMGHATSNVTMEVYAHYEAEQKLKETQSKILTLDRGIRLA